MTNFKLFIMERTAVGFNRCGKGRHQLIVKSAVHTTQLILHFCLHLHYTQSGLKKVINV